MGVRRRQQDVVQALGARQCAQASGVESDQVQRHQREGRPAVVEDQGPCPERVVDAGGRHIEFGGIAGHEGTG